MIIYILAALLPTISKHYELKGMDLETGQGGCVVKTLNVLRTSKSKLISVSWGGMSSISLLSTIAISMVHASKCCNSREGTGTF
jgi:hypothetical protein